MIILIILSVIVGLKIFLSKGQQRFNWCICGMLLLSSSIVLINKPQLPAHRFFLICFWLSVIYRKEYKKIKFPLIVPFLIYIIGFYYIGWHAEALSTFSKIWKPTYAIIESYLVLLLAFYGTKNVSIHSKPIIITVFIVTLYGILTLLIKHNPYNDLINSSSDMSWLQGYYFGDRTRITSTWSHPIPYGFICSLLFYMFLPYFKERKIKILSFLLIINVFLSGSRTALAAFILIGVLYILIGYKASKGIRVGLVALVFSFGAYIAVPYIHDKVDQLMGTVMGTDTTGGSSNEMRETQLASAMVVFSQSPIYGHGPDYVQEQMMGQNADYYVKAGLDFYGFESYLYIILIERGIIGCVIELVMLISILLYGLRERKRNKKESAYVISFLLGFVFFSLATGTMGTFIMTMMFIGMAMRRIYDKQIPALVL